MIGVVISFVVALCKTGTDLTTKHATTKIQDNRLILLVQRAAAVVVVLPVILILGPAFLGYVPGELVGPDFWWLVLINATLNGAAFFFYIRAFRLSDASLVAPMMLFSPIFLLVTSPIMLGEYVPLVGVVGVILTTVGAYIMEFTPALMRERKFFEPVRRLASDRGVRSMTITAIIWSITSNIDKLGVHQSSPLLWVFAESLLIVLGFAIFFLLLNPRALQLSGRQITSSATPGVINAIGQVLQMIAITITYVPYVIAIKRLSSLFTVLLGRAIFKEKEKFSQRLTGALVMVSGVVLITLGSNVLF